MKTTLLTLGALLLSLKTAAHDFNGFRRSLSIDDRVYQEIRKFSYNDTSLPNDYVNSFIDTVQARLERDKLNYLATPFVNRPCQTSAQVTFFNGGSVVPVTPGRSQPATAIINEFESGLIKIEATGCIPGTLAHAALRESMADTFQLSVVSELRSSRPERGLTCQETYVFGLGTSNYCFSSQTSFPTGESYLFTQNLTNAPLTRANAPVFYRTMLLSFHEAGGNTYSHMVAYVRGAKVPSAVRSIARRRIQSTQRTTYETLSRNLH